MQLFQSRVFNFIQENRRRRALLIISLIVIPNALLVLPMFRGGYTQFLSAIDGVFIADARFIFQHWPYSSWNTFWYAGFPFDLFYTPLLPYVLAVFQKISSNIFLIPDLYRVFAGLFYVLTPLSIYFFTKQLVKRESTALIAAIAYSIIPFAYLVPDVFNDALGYGLSQWQLHVITRYADVPHMASLSLIPLAALFFIKTLQAPSYWRYLLTSVFIALVALFNWIGFLSLILLLTVILLSELFIGGIKQKIRRLLYIFILTFGFLAFWYTPEFIGASMAFGKRSLQSLTFILIPLLGLIGTLLLMPLFSHRPKRQPILIIGGWCGIFFIVILFHYLLNIDLIPQSSRYLPEFAMGASMLLSIAVIFSSDRLESLMQKNSIHSRIRLSWIFRIVSIIIVCCAFISLIEPSWKITQPHPDIGNSSEYQIARWLNENVQDGERVYATGSNAFWLNAFSNVPQVAGGSTQASTNIWWEAVAYNFDHYYDGNLSSLWARVFNVKYIVVNYQNSTVPYRNYEYPTKFEGLLEKAYELNGDVVYTIPLVNPNIAQIVSINEMNNLEHIESVVDYDNLKNYVTVIDQNYTVSSLKIISQNPNQLILNASVGEGQAIQIQITYDAEWQAYSETSQYIPIESDPLGFIILYPKSGEHIIQIRHQDKFSVSFGRAVTVLTLIVMTIYPILRRQCTRRWDRFSYSDNKHIF